MSLLNHPVVQGLFNSKIPFAVEDGAIVVHGFSKSGEAKLKLTDDGELECHTRYDQVNVLNTMDDLVHVAYEWWDGYKDRSPFEEPAEHWLPHFVRLNLVSVDTKTVTTVTPR